MILQCESIFVFSLLFLPWWRQFRNESRVIYTFNSLRGPFVLMVYDTLQRNGSCDANSQRYEPRTGQGNRSSMADISKDVISKLLSRPGLEPRSPWRPRCESSPSQPLHFFITPPVALTWCPARRAPPDSSPQLRVTIKSRNEEVGKVTREESSREANGRHELGLRYLGILKVLYCAALS